MIDLLVDPNKEQPPKCEKRAGYFEVRPELLADLLLLPSGVKIAGVHDNFETGQIEIRVEGGDLPVVKEGCRPTRLWPNYRRVSHSTPEFVSWGI